ncbi:transglutaminase domain-containing protein [Paenibacillus sp. FSL L8-0470]|uniref:DUF4129 domain-containing transglutaminase family protein n=1 Tax=Paenibacillus sp. FSL L8-0470 TaxID=2954688 RepID=UPI0030FB0CED
MNLRGNGQNGRYRGTAGISADSSSTWKDEGPFGKPAVTVKPQAVDGQAENSYTDNREDIPLHYRLLFSLAIMGLFMAWLLPLHRSTTLPPTAELLEILMLSAAALLLWGCFRLPGLLQLSIRSILIALTWLYTCASSEGIAQFGPYVAGIPEDAVLLFTGQISQLSEHSRLLILILGWGLLVSSVQQLALYRGSTALFAAVTVCYLLMLDIGFGVKTTGEVLVSAGLILWMQGMSGLLRLKERTGRVSLPYVRWGGSALAGAMLLTAASWIGGQLYGTQPAVPITLKPVFNQLQEWATGQVQRQTEEEIRLEAGTTGYGSGKGELGAALSPSTKAVFTVTSSRTAYWRGESSAYYDGRRWIREGTAYIPLSLTSLPAGDLPVFANNEDQTLVQEIQFAVPSSGNLPLFSAGTVVNVEQVRLADGSRLGYVLANREKNSFRLPETASSAKIAGYTVSSLLPESDPAVLRVLGSEDPESIADSYLQLPAAMPERVAALAQRLTASAVSRYDAVAAVRNYLQSGYSYSLQTRIPPAGADFADDFIFTTKQGYCVHFATAMTVLLRSSGIPARYVQGYGPGTPEADSSPQRYAVTQGDAHAWVEVYFPGAGWIPFDPTPGAALAAAGPAAAPAAAASAPQGTPASAAAGADILPALPLAGGNPAPPAAAAALVLAAAWRWRRSLALLPAARRAGSVSRERQLRAAALAWRGLAARYGPPLPGVTAREYAASLNIEDAGLRTAVRGFVRQWETLAYSGTAQAQRATPRPGPAPPPPDAAAAEAAGFISRCLLIIFRLT